MKTFWSRYHVGRIAVLLLTVVLLTSSVTLAGCAITQRTRDGGASTSVAPAPTLTGPGATSTDHSLGYGDAGSGANVAQESVSAYDKSVAAPSVPRGSDVAVDVTKRLIVRDQAMRLEVKKTEAALESIRGLAKRFGGIVTQIQIATDQTGGVVRPMLEGEPVLSGSGMPLGGWITVRVPVDKFEAFVDGARKLGKLQSQAQSTDDVTQQHIDLVARLDNLRAQELQIRGFFEKATKVSELIAVESELARVRGEIEALQAQKDYLERQAALATVTIELVEPTAIVRPSGYNWGVAEALTTGLRALVGTFNAIIVVTLGAFPLVLLVVALLFLARFVMRRRTRKPEALAAVGDSHPDAGGRRVDSPGDDAS